MKEIFVAVALIVFLVRPSFAKDNYFWAPCPEATEDSNALSVDDLIEYSQTAGEPITAVEVTTGTNISIDQTQYHIAELKREWKDEVYYNNTTLSFKEWVAEKANKN